MQGKRKIWMFAQNVLNLHPQTQRCSEAYSGDDEHFIKRDAGLAP